MLFVKDPDAVLDYGFTFASWLATGETISSASWTLSPTGGVVIDTGFPNFTSGRYNDGTIVLVALQGGTAGSRYTATVHAVSSAGREWDDSFTLLVQQR